MVHMYKNAAHFVLINTLNSRGVFGYLHFAPRVLYFSVILSKQHTPQSSVGSCLDTASTNIGEYWRIKNIYMSVAYC